MKTLGIIGAGQLSLMLAEAARKIGIKVNILGGIDDPAMRAADEKYVESKVDSETLTRLLSTCDYGTIESEFVDSAAIESVLHQLNRRVQFTPLPKSVRIAQDKLSQKELFARLHLPTAKHREIKP